MTTESRTKVKEEMLVRFINRVADTQPLNFLTRKGMNFILQDYCHDAQYIRQTFLAEEEEETEQSKLFREFLEK